MLLPWLLALATAAAAATSAAVAPWPFWPRYGGARRVALLDGEWLFGSSEEGR